MERASPLISSAMALLHTDDLRLRESTQCSLCATRSIGPQLPGLRPDLEGSGRSPLKGELSIDGFVADMAHCWPHSTFPRHMLWDFARNHGLPASGSQLPERVKSLVLLGRLRRRRSMFGSNY